MNKKGFIDFEEVNPVAVLFGVAGGFFAFWISGNPFGTLISGDEVIRTGMFWRIMSGVLTAIVSFFVVQKMSE